MRDILLITASFTIILTLLCVFYLVIKIYEHWKIRNNRIKGIKEYSSKIPNSFSDLYIEQMRRTFVFYYSYTIQTTINLACKIMSLICSISSFSIQAYQALLDQQELSCELMLGSSIVSFSAIIFVIVIIYVKPQKRSAQYLLAWRKMNYRCDQLNNEMNHAMKTHNNCEMVLLGIAENQALFMKEIEDSLEADIDD